MPEDTPGTDDVAVRTGSIEIVVGIDADGQSVMSFQLNDVPVFHAIGYLTSILDVLRETKLSEWRTTEPPDHDHGP